MRKLPVLSRLPRPLRAQRCGAVACAATLALGAAAAAAQGTVFGADPQSWLTPQGVAFAFQQACIRTEAQAEGAVDWALTQGFEPLDVLMGSTHEMLQGQPGAVLAAPGSEGRVMLVVTTDRQCTVWAQRANGPALRIAVGEAMGRLTAAGARVQLDLERNIERSGVWRSQQQWRYRAAGGGREFGIGAATTLTATPATQALNIAPLSPAAPDPISGR
jgi:hypothetical protein